MHPLNYEHINVNYSSFVVGFLLLIVKWFNVWLYFLFCGIYLWYLSQEASVKVQWTSVCSTPTELSRTMCWSATSSLHSRLELAV